MIGTGEITADSMFMGRGRGAWRLLRNVGPNIALCCVALAGIAAGLIAARLGNQDAATWIWALASLPVLIALLFQIVIRPLRQFRAGVLREEFRRGAQRSQFPRTGLGAVLAKLELRRSLRLRPGAGHAGEPARLVLAPEFRHSGRNRHLLALQDFHHRFGRAPTTGRSGIRLDLRLAIVGHGALRAKEMHDSVERS